MADYYNSCAIPKPGEKKTQKKKCNGWKNKPQRVCAYCGEPTADRHEVFGGNGRRQNSLDAGYQVDVCRAHHDELQKNITPWAKKENLKLRRFFQKQFEDKLISTGIEPEKARDLFRKSFHKSYL